MNVMLGATECLQFSDEAMHVLDPRLVGDEYRIARIDDDEVLDAERGYVSAIAADIGLFSVDSHNVGTDEIARMVLVAGGRLHFGSVVLRRA